MPGQTSSTLLRGASVNPSKTRFSLRNKSHAVANELLPGWTHCLLLQAGFQDGMCEGGSPLIENRELALSNAQVGRDALQKTESGYRCLYQSREMFIPQIEEIPKVTTN